MCDRQDQLVKTLTSSTCTNLMSDRLVAYQDNLQRFAAALGSTVPSAGRESKCSWPAAAVLEAHLPADLVIRQALPPRRRAGIQGLIGWPEVDELSFPTHLRLNHTDSIMCTDGVDRTSRTWKISRALPWPGQDNRRQSALRSPHRMVSVHCAQALLGRHKSAATTSVSIRLKLKKPKKNVPTWQSWNTAIVKSRSSAAPTG